MKQIYKKLHICCYCCYKGSAGIPLSDPPFAGICVYAGLYSPGMFDEYNPARRNYSPGCGGMSSIVGATRTDCSIAAEKSYRSGGIRDVIRLLKMTTDSSM